MNENKEIRFITPDYKELFRIPDGGSIVLTLADGEENIGECKYLDATHFSLSGSYWHICQYAELLERNGATVRPEAEPEINQGYRIIRRNPVKDIVFKLGFNPNAAAKYVTWQSYPDNPDRYDWGHYWNDKTTASADLFRRVDSERNGTPYDHTELFKPQKVRNDAR
jgi:hypothetical protein